MCAETVYRCVESVTWCGNFVPSVTRNCDNRRRSCVIKPGGRHWRAVDAPLDDRMVIDVESGSRLSPYLARWS
jgi:hypothetical protein